MLNKCLKFMLIFQAFPEKSAKILAFYFFSAALYIQFCFAS